MQKTLDVTTAQEVYEIMVDKIAQVPSELVSSLEWKKLNIEFYDFIEKVGNHKIFREPLIVLNSILLFGIAEDYKLGYKLASPIYGNIKDREGINSIWELKLFMRVSIFLSQDFLELKELSKYAFDFLESCDNNIIYEKSALICNTMTALLKMNKEDSLKHKEEIEEIFNRLYSDIKDIGEKYKIDLYLKNAKNLYDRFTTEEKFNDEIDIEDVINRDASFLVDFNDQVINFHNEDKVKELKSVIEKLKSNLGGN